MNRQTQVQLVVSQGDQITLLDLIEACADLIEAVPAETQKIIDAIVIQQIESTEEGTVFTLTINRKQEYEQ